MMTEEKAPEVTLTTQILVALALLVPALVILIIVSWAVYSPFSYNDAFNKLAYVDIQDKIPDAHISFDLYNDPTGWPRQVLQVRDNSTRTQYTIRIVEQPDYGAALPIPPKEVVNSSGTNDSIHLVHILNPCTISRLIITTDKSYFIKDFPQTAICG